MTARRWLLLVLCCAMIGGVAPAAAETVAPGDGLAPAARPRLLVTPQRLERLRALAAAQSPQWRRLINWAMEPARHHAQPQDGPGLALAALALKPVKAQQAAGLGRLAVACALAGAPSGQVQAVARNTLNDPKRMGVGERLGEMGFTLINPNQEQDRVWRISRYLANGFAVEPPEPPLSSVAKPGDTYLLLADEVERANRLAGQVAYTLDWAWEWFTPQERQAAAAWLVAQAKVFAGKPGGCFDRAAVAHLRLTTLSGLAAQGLRTEAADLARQAREDRFAAEVLPCLRQAGAGGAWFEGSGAGAAAGLDLIETVAAMASATGENLSQSAPWFADRLGYLAFHLLPGVEVSPRGGHRRPAPDGDEPMAAGEASDLIRLQMLMLSALRPGDPAAGWALALVMDRRTPRVLSDHHLGKEFLWTDPDATVAPLTSAPLSWLAPALGRAFTRSDWSERATWLGFACGPHYAAAQHLDAGSLLLYRRGLLLGRGGLFDGVASPHTLNYSLRTLAHNTVVVHDPQEYSWYDLREGAQKRGHYANDGGQRAWSLFDAQGRPTQTAPWTATGWESGSAPWVKNRAVYDVAAVEALEDRPRFAYLRGNASAAYQGSTGKAARFHRHVFHLRPGGGDDVDAAEVVAVMDDLELAHEQPSSRFVLHFPTRPEVTGPLTQIGPGRWRGAAQRLKVVVEGARMDVVCLQPSPGQMLMFGEAGVADSWVGERNHPPRPPLVNPTPWRVEFGFEGGKGKARPMVHALLPMDAEAAPPPELTRLAAPDASVVGLVVQDSRWPRVVALRLGRPQAEAAVVYEYPRRASRHLVAGLAPGQSYEIRAREGRVSLTPGPGLKASPAGLVAFRLGGSGGVAAGEGR